MSYIDAYLDRNTDIIKVLEKDGKKSKEVEYPAQYVYYYEDPNGTYKSMWGVPCKKVVHNTNKAFRKDLERAIQSGKKIHESDINPVFRCLDDYYRDAELPHLNIAFFDIEVDFDPQKGFAPVEDPFNRITAISIYITDEEKMYTLALKPDLPENHPNFLSFDEADKICREFSDCYLCEDEEQLIKCFLEITKKVDIFSGWNCLDENSPILLNDRIVKLKNCKENDESIFGDTILKTHKSGLKNKNIITLENGIKINSSLEHKFPVISKDKEKYTKVNLLLETSKVMTLEDIKNSYKDKMLYFKLDLNGNNNKSLRWKDYIKDYFDVLLSYDWFDIVINDTSIRKKIWNFYKENNKLSENGFNYSFNRMNKVTNCWILKNHINILTTDEINSILSMDTIEFKFKNRRSFSIDLNDFIPNDYLQMLGFIFTDGHYSMYDKCFGFCNKKIEIMDYYCSIVNSSYSKGNDNCNYSKTCNTYIQLLSPMIYNNNWNKIINVELLSRLSTDQFSKFYSGCIDGDGSIGKYDIKLCEFKNNTDNFQTLLTWNGVYTTSRKNNTGIPFNEHNDFFINKMNIIHIDKKNNLENRKISKLVSAPSKDLKKFYVKEEKSFYIRIKTIEETNEMVQMCDIMTETQYFNCNGVKVHNSTYFDIPYIVNRMKRILPKHYIKELCLWNTEPKKKTLMKFGKEHESYDLTGKVHLDYLDLYRKHNTKEQHSYTLDHIGEIETGERKVQYAGSLDNLYKEDFRTFIDYSRQDVFLLDKIDKKRKYIQLSNQIAHQNCVLFQTTLGSVTLVEQAITHEVHSRGMIVPTKKILQEQENDFEYFEDEDEQLDDEDQPKKKDEDIPAIGAYVAKPKSGLHSYIGCCDINSLYPSTIRALNMSLETVYGQARTTYTDKFVEERLKTNKANVVWNDVFSCVEYQMIMDQTDDLITFDFTDGESIALKANEWYDFIFNGDDMFILSANGTLFRKDVDGVIPKLLEKWYANRKQLRKRAEVFGKLQTGIELPSDFVGKL